VLANASEETADMPDQTNPFCPTGAAEHAASEILAGSRDLEHAELLARAAERLSSYRDFVLGLMERASYAEVAAGLAEEVQELLGELGPFKVSITFEARDVKRILRGDSDSAAAIGAGTCVGNEVRRRVAGEAGDVVFYLVAILAKAGIDPLEVLARNRAKIEDRLARGTIRGTGEAR
jgi:NTP pyrophosphatase (non-canonical NTP hydrolase)